MLRWMVDRKMIGQWRSHGELPCMLLGTPSNFTRLSNGMLQEAHSKNLRLILLAVTCLFCLCNVNELSACRLLVVGCWPTLDVLEEVQQLRNGSVKLKTTTK